MPRRPQTICQHCGHLKRGPTCPTCRATPYDNQWRTISHQLIASHVAAYGWVCPGLTTGTIRHDPHPSSDLTGDHINGNPHDHNPTNLRVLCRSLNTQLRQS